jgi:6-phosphogluconolactonase
MDPGTGALTEPELAAEIRNPSFLAIAPNRKFLYAVGEIDDFNGKRTGAVNAFSIDGASGKLTLLNQQSSEGTGPAHVAVDKSGKVVLVANYGGGSVSALPVQADGKLGEATSKIQHTGSSVNPSRQKEPHAHSFNLAPDNRFAFAADLGLDKIFIYKLDSEKGTLTPNDPPFGVVKPGSGPRHFAFHPNGRFAYVINEIVCTVTAFSYDAKRGALTEIETVSTLPPDEAMKPSYSTAEVQVHPSGKFVYGSNRGHNTIVVYAVDQKTGRLTWVENQSTQGKTPRNFGIEPGGRFLLAANQDSDDVFVYRIDLNTGKLTPTGASVKVGAPVCVKFLVLGR